jgi:hypothetical protein
MRINQHQTSSSDKLLVKAAALIPRTSSAVCVNQINFWQDLLVCFHGIRMKVMLIIYTRRRIIRKRDLLTSTTHTGTPRTTCRLWSLYNLMSVRALWFRSGASCGQRISNITRMTRLEVHTSSWWSTSIKVKDQLAVLTIYCKMLLGYLQYTAAVALQSGFNVAIRKWSIPDCCLESSLEKFCWNRWQPVVWNFHVRTVFENSILAYFEI